MTQKQSLKAFVAWQHFLPQHWLSRFLGGLAHCRVPWFKNLLIRSFIAHFNVDMEEAAETSIDHYVHFNDFFTRALRSGARPMAEGAATLISPVDGAISEMGRLAEGRILQAKNKFFSVESLLGGDEQRARGFHNGHFMTAYLSPKDYHRIHMPCDARLLRMVYVPGKLFSVNPASVSGIDGLFARNERVICYFETARGPMALVAVGAMVVASIVTTWHGEVAPSSMAGVQSWDYDDQEIQLHRGDEMGYFKLGSTVILLFPEGAMEWDNGLAADDSIKLGQALGQWSD